MNAASMPMYDIPEVRKALDDLWCGLSHGMRCEGLTNVPDKLLHGVDVAVLWDDPITKRSPDSRRLPHARAIPFCSSRRSSGLPRSPVLGPAPAHAECRWTHFARADCPGQVVSPAP